MGGYRLFTILSMVVFVIAASILIALLLSSAGGASNARHVPSVVLVQFGNGSIGVVIGNTTPGTGLGRLIANNTVDVLAIATLPRQFTITGVYADLLRSVLGIPRNSAVEVSVPVNGWVRLAWHIDYLTLVMPNGTEVVIEVKTQVIQFLVNGTWVTVPPAFIRPSYDVTIIKGNETLSAIMVVARQLLRDILRSPPRPPSIIMEVTIIPPLILVPGYVPPSYLWQNYTHASSPHQLPQTRNYVNLNSSDPTALTWALSGFVNVNSSSEVCGYVYPLNGSDLVMPVSDYAGVPLTIFQELNFYYTVNGSTIHYIGFLMAQSIAQLWPPTLMENTWVFNDTPPYQHLISVYNYSLTSPVDWLATGVTLCISQLSLGNGNYELTLTAVVNGQNYTIATINEDRISNYDYEITVNINGKAYNSTQQLADPVLDSVSYPYILTYPYNVTLTFYPSIAFETNDTSTSFFGGNTNFALELQVGNSPSSVGEWPLYYSISNDTWVCQGIWGSSGVGTTWSPSNTVWGASGSTTEITYERLISYDAAVGSIGQLRVHGYTNTVGIACNYVDTDLSALNTKTMG
ncbi:hypothetical protein JCM14467A_05380 [Vulcanisaeta sp. JCM 14467]